jgi:hypothetical protein
LSSSALGSLEQRIFFTLHEWQADRLIAFGSESLDRRERLLDPQGVLVRAFALAFWRSQETSAFVMGGLEGEAEEMSEDHTAWVVSSGIWFDQLMNRSQTDGKRTTGLGVF